MKIAGKIISCVVVMLINLAISIYVGFFLLLGLNGFSDSQTTSGLVFFVFLVTFSGIFCGLLSVLIVYILSDKKSLNQYLASLIAVIVSGLVSLCVLVAGLFLSFIIVDAFA